MGRIGNTIYFESLSVLNISLTIKYKDLINTMNEENQTGSNAVWAIAFVIIVAIIGAVVYYSGILKTKPGKTEVDINVTAPAAPAR